MLSATDLPEPDMPLTIISRRVRASLGPDRLDACGRLVLHHAAFQEVAVAGHERRRRIDALGAQDMQAGGGFGQHRQVAAGASPAG